MAALIRFKQGATIGGAGQALIALLADGEVEVSCVDTTGIGSWEIRMLEVPYGSAINRGIMSRSNSSAPVARFTPDVVGGCYRIMLRTWPRPNRAGAVSVDIRNVGLVAGNGSVVPPPQVWPAPLPHPNTGRSDARPNEMNFGGQRFGWYGNGNDGLVRHIIRTAGPGVQGPQGPAGPKGEKGADGAKGLTGPAGTAQAIQLHDTTHSPVLLLQLQGSLSDTSGNSYTPTTDTGGPVMYGTLCPGVRGFLAGSVRLGGTTSQHLLRIYGDMTILAFVKYLETPNGNPWVSFTGGQDDSSSVPNYIWQSGVDTLRRPNWFQEHGTGTNASQQITTDALPMNRAFHFAQSRIGGVIRTYADGRQLGVQSSVLPAPTDGSGSRFFLGGTGDVTPVLCGAMLIASLKIVPSGLSAAQIEAEYNRTMGRFYGYIPAA